MHHSQTSVATHRIDPAMLCQRAEHSYYAEVSIQRLDEQLNLLDQIIDFAFDTLDARHLDLRVVDARCGIYRAA